jgi:hypothetical protein
MHRAAFLFPGSGYDDVMNQENPFDQAPAEQASELDAIIERVQKKDEKLKQEFADALSSVVNGPVEISNFTWLGDKKFEVQFEAGGEQKKAIIQ